MKSIVQLLDSWKVFFLSVISLTCLVVVLLWPASYWYDVESVIVADGTVNRPISMAVDRTVHRPFYGQWVVTVRKKSPAGWEPYCDADGGSNYDPVSALPPDLGMKWWTNGQCTYFEPGEYFIDTAWFIRPTLNVLPWKSTSIRSNIFKVTDDNRNPRPAEDSTALQEPK